MAAKDILPRSSFAPDREAGQDPVERITQILSGEDRSDVRRRQAKGQPRDAGRFARARQAAATEEAEEELDVRAQAGDDEEPDELEDEREPADDAAEEEGDELQGEPGDEGDLGDEDADGDAASGDADEEGVFTLPQLAEALDLSPEELTGHLQVEGPDGESVSLADVLSAYSESPERAQSLSELETQRSEIESQRSTLRQQADARLNDLVGHIRALGRVINPQQEMQDLRRLREENPQQYLIMRDEIDERNAIVRNSIEEIHRETRLREQENAEKFKKWTAQQVQALRRAMPSWRDPKEATKAQKEIQAYLRRRGFTNEEINQLADHRMVLTVWDAIQFKALGQKRPDVRKQLARLKGKAKVLPGAARRQQEGAATTRRSKALARLRRSGSVSDAGRVIEGML